MENLALYYTYSNDKQIMEKMGRRPYVLKGKITQVNNCDTLRFFVNLVAVDQKTQKKIGACDFMLNNMDKVCDLVKISIIDHSFDHCGVATKMIKTMENFALDHNCKCIMGVLSPDEGYEDISPKFYAKNNYLITNSYWLIKDKATGTLFYNKEVVQPEYSLKVVENEEIKDIDQFILLNTHKTNVKTK